jgi:hypothetical protein
MYVYTYSVLTHKTVNVQKRWYLGYRFQPVTPVINNPKKENSKQQNFAVWA